MIGIDIVSIARISRLKERFGYNFLRRFLSEDEINLAKSNATLAGFWATKEAASKALGVGIGAQCGFMDIKISKNKNNAPILEFSEFVKNEFKVKNASVSITHDGGFAIAAVLISN